MLAARAVGRVAEVSAAGAALVCDAGGVGALLDLLPQRNRARFGAGATHAVWKVRPPYYYYHHHHHHYCGLD